MQTRSLLAYSLPSFAVTLPTIPIYIHLPTLYGVHLELGLAATGLMLLISRSIDTLTDPIVGILSDRFSYKGNYRKPWIAAGSVIAGIGIYKLLNPPEVVDLYFLLIWSVTLYIGWTLVAVPYLTWGAELSTDYNERTTITTCRELGGIIGILASGAIVAIAAFHGLSELDSIRLIAWAAIFAGGITIPYMLFYVPDANIGRYKLSRSVNRSILNSCLELASNKPFIRLISAWFLNGLANGIPAVLFFLYLDKVLGAGEIQRAVLIVIYFSAAVMAMPIWLLLSKFFGKHKIWCYAMLLAVSAFSIVPLLPEGSFNSFVVICILTGMCLGADLSIPPAIQADVVDYDKLRFGGDRAGLLFALWGMITKLALACSVGIAFPVLQWLGFQTTEPGEYGKFLLTILYALIPVGFKIITVVIIWSFPITSKKHQIIRQRLYGKLRGTDR